MDLPDHALVPSPRGQRHSGLQDFMRSVNGLSSRGTEQGQNVKNRVAGGHPQGPTLPSEIERSPMLGGLLLLLCEEGLGGSGERL